MGLRFVPLFLIVTACFAGVSRESKLAMNLNRYGDDIRWARWSDATGMMVPSLREPYMEAGRRRGPDFRVADLEMGSLRMNEDQSEAVVTMEVRWYTARQTFMRATLLEQQWKWLDGEWMLVRERQASGEPM